MGHILNHNRQPLNAYLSMSDYWDFFLYTPNTNGVDCGVFNNRCLSAYIDINNPVCITGDGIQSVSEIRYSKCVSKGITLNNIGFTGTDNGLITFDKKNITSEEFDELLKNSTYLVEENDCRLKLQSVDGNNGLFSYVNEIVEEDGFVCAKLNGGFFQGFFMTGDGCQYKILPNKLGEEGWGLEFELKMQYFSNGCLTLNDIHPENRGTFFFMGTRAENKWVRYYDTNCPFEKSELKPHTETVQYVQPEYCDCDTDMCGQNLYFTPGYVEGESCECANYFKEDYMELIEEDKEEGTVKETNDGHILEEGNVVEIESENKYLLFDRSCEGVTTKTYEEGDKAIVQYRKLKNEENYFQLFSRSCDGMTVKEYNKYFDEHANLYDIYKDLYRNAFALQIKPDGSIGYKYFVANCEEDASECSYKIESEFSNPCNVGIDKWTKIYVRILRLGASDKMKIMIYVDGKLRLVSKDLPEFNFRNLDDTEDKQEGVPFNISLGGGTQGLCDVIYNDFNNIPEYIYPLEKEFGGSFTGYFKSFKFYECPPNFNEITCKDFAE